MHGATFYLHDSLVSSHSKSLDRIINSEARKGYAVLGDVGESTFARFAEWMYKGFYHTSAVDTFLRPDDPGSSQHEEAKKCPELPNCKSLVRQEDMSIPLPQPTQVTC